MSYDADANNVGKKRIARKRPRHSKHAEMGTRKVSQQVETQDVDDTMGRAQTGAVIQSRRDYRTAHEPVDASTVAQAYETKKFVDDRSGRKPVHPSALRYTLKLVEQEAKNASKTVSEMLLEGGEEEDHRKVQVLSAEHTAEIVATVRKRLRTAMIPARYIRIDDVDLESLGHTNQKRRAEIAKLKTELRQLESQNKEYQTEHQRANAARQKLETPQGEVHSLLTAFVKPPLDTCTSSSVTAAVKRPADKSKLFSALLEKMPSVYD